MKLSYLVTVHNESVQRLFETLYEYKGLDDEVVVLDDFSDDAKTQKSLKDFGDTFKVVQHALDRNYGAHKNFGNELCTGDWVFQIDGDEIPNPVLILNVKDIIEANPNVELLYVPRINDFKGVQPEHARQWGWNISSQFEGRPIINWPDYQSRIYKRDPARIRWDRRLHEKIEGYTAFGTIPADFELALYHDKTIETQLKTNLRYNEWFTQEENQGHNVFDKKK